MHNDNDIDTSDVDNDDDDVKETRPDLNYFSECDLVWEKGCA